MAVYHLRSRGYCEEGKTLTAIKVPEDLASAGYWNFEPSDSKKMHEDALTLKHWYTGSVMIPRGKISPQQYAVYTTEKNGEVGIFIDSVYYVVSPTLERFLSKGIPNPLDQCERYDLYGLLGEAKTEKHGLFRRPYKGEHELKYTMANSTPTTSTGESDVSNNRVPKYNKPPFGLLEKLKRGRDTSSGSSILNTPASTREPLSESSISTVSSNSEDKSTEQVDKGIHGSHKGDRENIYSLPNKHGRYMTLFSPSGSVGICTRQKRPAYAKPQRQPYDTTSASKIDDTHPNKKRVRNITHSSTTSSERTPKRRQILAPSE